MSRYVAGIRMPVGDRIVQRGDPVPEAATWRNLSAWVSAGKIVLVEDLPAWVSAGKIVLVDSPPSSPANMAPPSSGGGLRAALIATAADSSSYTARALVALAEAEGVDMPEKMPRSKARLVETLAEIVGLNL
jgi:hypothetical protein